MKTQSQQQSVNAPSVRHHLAHRMKHPQIRLWPHCPIANDANQRKNAKKTNKRKQTEENGHKQQQPIQNEWKSPRTKKKQSERKQMQANCKKPKQEPAKYKEYATISKQTKANDNIPKQMMVNGD